MIDLASPYEGFKVLFLGLFFGYRIARYRFKKKNGYKIVNIGIGGKNA